MVARGTCDGGLCQATATDGGAPTAAEGDGPEATRPGRRGPGGSGIGSSKWSSTAAERRGREAAHSGRPGRAPRHGAAARGDAAPGHVSGGAPARISPTCPGDFPPPSADPAETPKATLATLQHVAPEQVYGSVDAWARALQAQRSSFEPRRRRDPTLRPAVPWTPAGPRRAAPMLDTGVTHCVVCVQLGRTSNLPTSSSPGPAVAMPDTARSVPRRVVVRLALEEAEPLREAMDKTRLDPGAALDIAALLTDGTELRLASMRFVDIATAPAGQGCPALAALKDELALVPGGRQPALGLEPHPGFQVGPPQALQWHPAAGSPGTAGSSSSSRPAPGPCLAHGPSSASLPGSGPSSAGGCTTCSIAAGSSIRPPVTRRR